MKILLGLSGGVDSTTAALILKQQGHEVIGATMSIWGNKGNTTITTEHKNSCYGPDEAARIEETRKIAQQLDIPFYIIDCSNQYEKIVLNNFKSEYIVGRTPNPCVVCNSMIKFGALPMGAKENGIEFDKFATGHYVRVEEQDGRYLLKRGTAINKDQSYFLYRLTQEQLKNIMFPLGGYTKDEIRKIAQDFGLDVATKPDSQDFYGGDYNELLGINEKRGNIVDTTGKILGTHAGIWNYTIGQRKGLGVSAPEPLYVLSLNKETNEVVVGYADKTFKKSLVATNINWIGIPELSEPRNSQAKIRSTQQPVNVILTPDKNGDVIVEFEDLQKSIAIGQSAVFYDGDIVLGGGIIDKVL